MAMGLTQPLREISTRNLPGAKGWPVCKTGNPTTIFEPVAWKMWESRHLTTLQAPVAFYRDTVTFFMLWEYELNWTTLDLILGQIFVLALLNLWIV
jgi:hypothetical protein